MKTYQRRQEIYQFIFDRKTVKISELKEVFHVSEVTLRSDLDFLESEEKIERLHGGAAIIEKTPPQAESVLPDTPLLEAKLAITKKAAELIVPGDTIFLDSSATSIILASQLNPELNITVITNSLPIINQLKLAPGIRLYAIPGLYNPSTNSFNGPLGEAFISNLKTSKTFISPKGIIVEGLRDLTADEAAIRKAMINSTREPIVIVDHSKFDHSETLFQISDFSPISTVVTDRTPSPVFVDILQTRKITLITTESGA
ncbi:DeoR/GlpR family DNA-binding transcription regulator [Paenibacillus spongiae]|uniref:DeoR/GlpR family DNA-binding transcription regulator n=1 Tax=Paenibacillus spongiae TaxID=2909671 RepID=A0ABY5S6L6_9BACL|nr:DeoR/GlpR family DNA-binding transcription regulator [Paenibacillus spongiae]UVI28368.1 DeoR/GlpR family DNA-binding transcription regulator [Paenibacillus spongiae]